jgi:hypothetical protein
MSVVEDVRQIIQDFLAPELRSISARLDAIEKTAQSRHEELLARIAASEARIEGRIVVQEEKVIRLESSLSNQISDLKSAFEFDKRLSRLEAEKKSA